MLVGLASVLLPARVTEKLLLEAKSVAMLAASVRAVISPLCAPVKVWASANIAWPKLAVARVPIVIQASFAAFLCLSRPVVVSTHHI